MSKTVVAQRYLIWYLGAVVVSGWLCGCRSESVSARMLRDNPEEKLRAIVQAGESRDEAAVPALVEQLDSDDPAVRMMAIRALERITGERLGYNPYAMPEHRRASVDQWAQRARQGESFAAAKADEP